MAVENEYDHFVHALGWGQSKLWWNNYFSTLKRLFVDLNIGADSPKIALNIGQDLGMPVNIGQRYVAYPDEDGYLWLIFPIDADLESLNVQPEGFFTRKKVKDAKGGSFTLSESQPLPEPIYQAWKRACQAEWDRTIKSGFRKYHQGIYFDAIMSESTRQEILEDAFKEIV